MIEVKLNPNFSRWAAAAENAPERVSVKNFKAQAIGHILSNGGGFY